mmetsp:Transcript_18440/g.69776  ORF Transcript_18440/g.69776 Transcript_18440/m.69776 type:complete len:243 (+) Transcript_18440:617-1345(+)
MALRAQDWRLAASMDASASDAMVVMVCSDSFGQAPLVVSPLSMTQSAPSSTALATSDTSARVGRGFLIIESSICVAQITGFPRRLQHLIMYFCATNTFSKGISMPRSPRATMIPSDASRMLVKFCTPSRFSIFEMILMCGLPACTSTSRISCTCSGFRTKDAKIMSTSWAAANLRSPASLADTAGRFTIAPGRFTPLREPSMAELRATQMTLSSRHFVTSKRSRPSSMKIMDPGDTVLAMSG